MSIRVDMDMPDDTAIRVVHHCDANEALLPIGRQHDPGFGGAWGIARPSRSHPEKGE